MSEKTVEQLLREGVPANELKAQLDKEINAAQTKMATEEEATKANLKQIRRDLIGNAIAYIKALDLDEDFDMNEEELEETLEELESELVKYEKILKILLEDKTKARAKENKEDERIRKFLRGIM